MSRSIGAISQLILNAAKIAEMPEKGRQRGSLARLIRVGLLTLAFASFVAVFATQAYAVDLNCTGVPDGVTCHVATGACDTTQVCTSGVCPPSLLPFNTFCRSASACEDTAFCTGTSPDCPHPFKPRTTLCGPATNSCENNTFCTGDSAKCPDNLKTPTIVGVADPKKKITTIKGTEEADVIDATHGTFWVKPKGGDDCILLDGGNDRVDSSPGNDTILDTAGANNLNGGEDDDLIIFDSSGKKNTKARGGKGNDNISDECESNCGDDLLRGGEDDDSIHGGAGNNFLAGDEGNDSIDVPLFSSGNNCIDGGPGSGDVCIGNFGGANCCVNCEFFALCQPNPSDPNCVALNCKQ